MQCSAVQCSSGRSALVLVPSNPKPVPIPHPPHDSAMILNCVPKPVFDTTIPYHPWSGLIEMGSHRNKPQHKRWSDITVDKSKMPKKGTLRGEGKQKQQVPQSGQISSDVRPRLEGIGNPNPEGLFSAPNNLPCPTYLQRTNMENGKMGFGF